MRKRAHEATAGDLFALALPLPGIALAPIGDGKRVRVTIELEDQGHRTLRPGYSAGSSSLEFTDDGHTLEFICLSRWFHTLEDWDEDDDDDEPDPVDPPSPRSKEPVS